MATGAIRAVFDALLYVTISLLLFLFVFGTEGRDGMLGRVADGVVISMTSSIDGITSIETKPAMLGGASIGSTGGW